MYMELNIYSVHTKIVERKNERRHVKLHKCHWSMWLVCLSDSFILSITIKEDAVDILFRHRE